MEVTSIILLDDILRFAKSGNLDVFYLTGSNGVSFSDDIVKAPDIPTYRYDAGRALKYNTIIAEEMSRKCIQFQTPKVYFMRRTFHDKLDMSVKLMKSRGVQVIQPILGYSIAQAKSILERGML